MGREGKIEEFRGDSSEVIVDEAIRFISESKKQNKPSFTVIWFGTPHGPFRASEEDIAAFQNLNQRSRDHYGELVAMDRSIGTLRDALRKLNIADNTLVWFTSDNGGLPRIEGGTTGGLRGHKGSLYEGGIRVPGIIEWPAQIKNARVTNYPAVSMDIAPTVVSITGVNSNKFTQPVDGVDLSPLFKTSLQRRTQKIPFAYRDRMAVVDNELKLIRKRIRKTGQWSHELYDLSKDPGEQNNLFDHSKPESIELNRWLDQFENSLKNSLEGNDYPEGHVLPNNPKPTKWTELKKLERYFEDWKQRPEYRGYLKNWKK